MWWNEETRGLRELEDSEKGTLWWRTYRSRARVGQGWWSLEQWWSFVPTLGRDITECTQACILSTYARLGAGEATGKEVHLSSPIWETRHDSYSTQLPRFITHPVPRSISPATWTPAPSASVPLHITVYGARVSLSPSQPGEFLPTLQNPHPIQPHLEAFPNPPCLVPTVLGNILQFKSLNQWSLIICLNVCSHTEP